MPRSVSPVIAGSAAINNRSEPGLFNPGPHSSAEAGIETHGTALQQLVSRHSSSCRMAGRDAS
jgi:hypothetical protein